MRSTLDSDSDEDGTALCEGYDAMGPEMSKPRLRAEIAEEAAAPRCGIM